MELNGKFYREKAEKIFGEQKILGEEVQKAEGKWTDEQIIEFVEGKIDLMNSVKTHGLRDPLIVQEDDKLSDGGNRVTIMKELGYEKVIVRRV